MVSGHSCLLIRQMVALVRRAMAEVRPVPVLLVLTDVIRPMSHLQFYCASWSRNFIARQSCSLQLCDKSHKRTNQTWLLVALMVILLQSVYSIK